MWYVHVFTFMGAYRAKGACPWASSRTVMPKDQISARALYLPCQTTHLHQAVQMLADSFRYCQLRWGQSADKIPFPSADDGKQLVLHGAAAQAGPPLCTAASWERMSCAPLRLLHDLRRHPARSPHKGVTPASGKTPGTVALKGGRHPEVRKQHISIAVHQDVARLETSSWVRVLPSPVHAA